MSLYVEISGVGNKDFLRTLLSFSSIFTAYANPVNLCITRGGNISLRGGDLQSVTVSTLTSVRALVHPLWTTLVPKDTVCARTTN